MIKNTTKWFAILGGATLAALTAAQAQDSGALLDALVKKGILNDQEAEEIRADLTNDFHGTPWAIAGGKSTNSIAISGRVQIQYVAFDNENIADSTGFLIRRLYFGAKAKVAGDWVADFNYNFADSTFDKAYIGRGLEVFGQDADLNIGLRKVNFGYEEYTSSGSLKAIERSPATRWFVEAPGAAGNNRELGAASYRLGAFLDFNNDARKGKTDGLFYSFAITNPERQDASGAVGNRRGAANNTPAFWADLGYSFKTDSVSGKVGVAGSYIENGSNFDVAVADSSLTGISLFTDVSFGKLNLAAELLTAKVENGVAAGTDADPVGYWIQPSYMITDKFEVVGRYSHLDADGRGARLRDVIRRSDSTTTGEEVDEFYIGGNYYFSGKDLVLQFGYIMAESETAAGVTEETKGFRTQLQLNF